MHFARNWIPFAVLVALLSGRTAKAQYTLSTLAVFNDVDWQLPTGGLIADTSGNLYGTTVYGRGANSSGTVFKLSAGTHELTEINTLDGANGRASSGDLIADASGFYGTTQFGGLFNKGVIY